MKAENPNIQIEEMLRVWVCPDCGFTMDAVHIDEEDGMDSCPHCTEIELGKKLTIAMAELTELFNDYGRQSTADVLEKLLGHEVKWPLKQWGDEAK